MGHFPPHPSARTLVGIFALGLSVAAVAFAGVRPYETFLPWLWPYWFGTAAVLCWAYFVQPWRPMLHAFSGTFAVVGVLSRVGATALNMINDVYPSRWYGVLGLTVWPMFAAALLFVWHVGFTKLTADQRAARRKGGTCAAGR